MDIEIPAKQTNRFAGKTTVHIANDISPSIDRSRAN